VRAWHITTIAHAAFDGEGARRYGSRWTPKGVAVVYASATLSLAALERFVHADPDLEPADLIAVSVEADESIPIQVLDVAQLPAEWRTYPPPESLARFGADWVAEARTSLLAVPSAVIPHERNYLLNPAHPDFQRFLISEGEPFSFDPRMCFSAVGSKKRSAQMNAPSMAIEKSVSKFIGITS
jgi:RES domain-containing protein